MHFTRKNHTFILIAAFVLSFSLAASCFAQAPPPGGPEGFGHGRHGGPGEPGGPAGLRMGPPGRWWDNPDFAQKLSLSTDQQKKMDDIFNASRLKLIDLFASVQKEEAVMEPLVSADEQFAIAPQIPDCRVDLSKTNLHAALRQIMRNTATGNVLLTGFLNHLA